LEEDGDAKGCWPLLIEIEIHRCFGPAQGRLSLFLGERERRPFFDGRIRDVPLRYIPNKVRDNHGINVGGKVHLNSVQLNQGMNKSKFILPTRAQILYCPAADCLVRGNL